MSNTHRPQLQSGGETAMPSRTDSSNCNPSSNRNTSNNTNHSPSPLGEWVRGVRPEGAVSVRPEKTVGVQSGKSFRSLLSLLLIAAVIIIDQIIKYEVKTNFSLHEVRDVCGWFQLVFVENRGMAFGMQFVGTLFLALFRVAAIAFFCVMLTRLVRRLAPVGLIVCVSLIIAGAAGNIIDNMFNGIVYTESLPFASPATFVGLGSGEGYGSFMSGRVIDMFYFPLFEWPDWVPFLGGGTFFGAIFNFADAAISCGAVATALFYYRYLSHSASLFKKA